MMISNEDKVNKIQSLKKSKKLLYTELCQKHKNFSGLQKLIDREMDAKFGA